MAHRSGCVQSTANAQRHYKGARTGSASRLSYEEPRKNAAELKRRTRQGERLGSRIESGRHAQQTTATSNRARPGHAACVGRRQQQRQRARTSVQSRFTHRARGHTAVTRKPQRTNARSRGQPIAFETGCVVADHYLFRPCCDRLPRKRRLETGRRTETRALHLQMRVNTRPRGFEHGMRLRERGRTRSTQAHFETHQ
jgi:hypothetical protein